MEVRDEEEVWDCVITLPDLFFWHPRPPTETAMQPIPSILHIKLHIEKQVESPLK